VISLHGVTAFYGRSQVLHGVDLEVRDGQTIAVLGRNGVGKTTMLRAILGLVERRGQIEFDGKDISRWNTHHISRAGVQLVPENRGIFAALTVEENLRLAARPGAKWSLERVLETLPRLADRRRNYGDRLSGGEQQMLAIARALVAGPKLLLLDEPSEGLAPVIVEQIADIIRVAGQEGVSIVLVEQRLDMCLALADHLYVLETGAVVFDGSVEQFEADPSIKDRYLTLEVGT
jgi:branched-chain amino acid transport system ATP-binding protein